LVNREEFHDDSPSYRRHLFVRHVPHAYNSAYFSVLLLTKAIGIQFKKKDMGVSNLNHKDYIINFSCQINTIDFSNEVASD